MTERKTHPRWMSAVLYAAGVYNVAWGALVVLFFGPTLSGWYLSLILR